MIVKILPVLLFLVGTSGGIAAGLFLVSEGPRAEDAETDHAEPNASSGEYVKLANQFVVPVVERGRVSAHVVLSLNLEVAPGTRDSVYAHEPKLRADFLRALFDHANIGGFKGAFTTAEQLNPLRTALREVAQKELGPMVHSVLIVDIARQDIN